MDIKQFKHDLEVNDALLKKVETSNKVEELIVIAKNEGYEFTAEEFKSESAQCFNENAELSDEELRATSGGCMNYVAWKRIHSRMLEVARQELPRLEER